MEVAGLCDCCKRGSRALNTCGLCGRRVCSSCFNTLVGVCKYCTGGRNVSGSDKKTFS